MQHMALIKANPLNTDMLTMFCSVNALASRYPLLLHNPQPHPTMSHAPYYVSNSTYPNNPEHASHKPIQLNHNTYPSKESSVWLISVLPVKAPLSSCARTNSYKPVCLGIHPSRRIAVVRDDRPSWNAWIKIDFYGGTE